MRRSMEKILQLFGVRSGPIYRFTKPVVDATYRAFVRSFPCLICFTRRGVEAAHTGPHGLGQKASDETCVPFCHVCHRTGNASLHRLGPVLFEERHNVNLKDVAAMFRGMWQEKQRREAA